MSDTKYVIVDELYAVIFTASFSHAQFENLGKITSAGFCDFGVDEHDNPTVSAYGESFSLNIKSKPQDSDIINRSIVNPYF